MRKISLQFKVVVPVTVMIVLAIAGALAVVNGVVRNQVWRRVSSDLDKSRLVFKELQQRDWQLLRERSWVTAQAPHLKAAVDTGDSTTVQRVVGEMVHAVRGDILIVSDRAGNVLARSGLSREQIGRYHPDSLVVYEQVDEGEIGRLAFGGSIFHLVRSPILTLDSASNVDLLGFLLVGQEINGAYLQRLKELVKCEVAFRVGNQTRLATNSDVEEAKLAMFSENLSGPTKLRVNGEAFLAETAGVANSFLLLQSVDRAIEAIMDPIEKTMMGVGIFAIVVSILISSFISREILTPVKKLVRATDAVTAGEYGNPIDIKSRDEIGYLASKFDEMRLSLRDKMSQLRQQNIELEAAMKELEATQRELLRTEKLAATGKITAQLSHELNNPLHNIRACLETAQKKMDAAHGSRQFVDLAHEEVQRLGKLLRQMLDFYRPQQISKQKVRLSKLVNEVLKASEQKLREGRVKVTVALDQGNDVIFTAPDQLKQVLLNLTLNALDAMPNGGEITVTSRVNTRSAKLVFEDNGSGIAPQNLDRIFDAFFTTKSKASGVGLGLSVSYGIIKSMGGSIHVESEPKQGTRFVIELPVNEQEKVV